MESKELKVWIDANIKSIRIKESEYFFTKKTGYSPSKWKDDFKNLVGITLRDYLIREKMKICWDYKMSNRDYSNAELMAMVGYDLTERRFRTHMSEYEGKYLNKYTDCAEGVYLFHNTAVFSEILVRLILYLDLAKPEIEENYFLVEHNVKDTAYQIDNISSSEIVHRYKAFIRWDDLSLSFMGPWVENSLDDEGMGRFYNSMWIYVYYLERVNKQFQKRTGLSLTKSIKCWDIFRENTPGMLSIFLKNIFKPNDIQNSVMRLEINRRSKFILATDTVIDKIKESMLDRYKRKLMDWYSVAYDTMLGYVRAVDKLNYLKMRRLLETVNTLNDENVINLFFELTRYPYLNDVLSMGGGSDLDDDFVRKLSQSPKTEIIRFLIDLKKEIDQLAKNDEDYEEDIHNWCQNVAEKW